MYLVIEGVGTLFLEMEILPASLLAPHPEANFGCDSKKLGIYKWTPLNYISHKEWALVLEMEILSDCLLAPHPHTQTLFLISNIGCVSKNNGNF